MDWEKIDKLLTEQIANKTDMRTGYAQIRQMLAADNLPAADIDVDGLKKEFIEWLEEVITIEPIPKNIQSIYFGMGTFSFSEIDNGKERTTVYLTGSKSTPAQDADWACDTDYYPDRRYLLLNDFEKIDDLIKSSKDLDGDYEVLVFNGLLNLLVINSMDELKDKLLNRREKILGLIKTYKKRDHLYLGAGFDSGDLYLPGELNNE